MTYPLIIIIAIVVLVVLWFIMTNNSLIFKRNRVKQCQSGICVALKQRNDMIPNLVASVKTYMSHESDTLTKITELRTAANNAKSEEEQIKLGNELSGHITKLNLAVENYPNLKADTQFTTLQKEIIEVEYQLQAIRRTYNSAVTVYNNKIEMFPSSLVASMRGHKCGELIEIPEQEMQNVDVKSLFS